MFTTCFALPPADPDRAFVHDAHETFAQEAARSAEPHLLRLALPVRLTANGIDLTPRRQALRSALASGGSHLAHAT